MNPKVILGVRIVLGLILVLFGLNKFLNFMPAPEFSPEAMGFFGALLETGYMMPLVALVEIISGALLLAGRYVPLALLLLAPVVVNIVLFHLFLDLASIPPALLVTVLWLVLVFAHRDTWKHVLQA